MTARRPLLTATAAGSLLCALWLVPSASATGGSEADSPAATGQARSAAPAGQPAEVTVTAADGQDTSLADTGSVDITPYLFGGTAFLGLGVAMVTASVRRPRMPRLPG